MRKNLGHFELLEQIGKGGMATVFRAHDRSLNRKVAIKLLDDKLAREYPQFVEGFIREAQHAAATSHPNIVNIFFVGGEEGSIYIAMELLEGCSLADIIEKEGSQTEEAVLEIGLRMADALRAAYANQLVHGDIKPQKIFITHTGLAKLLDFGLAQVANMEVAIESDGGIWGSAYYISPERVEHKVEDFRSDIYSLGATLFHAFAGQPPFEAPTPGELAQKHLSQRAPALRTINPGISEITEKIIAVMLDVNPAHRYPDYDSLIADLVAAKAQLRNADLAKTKKPDQSRAPVADNPRDAGWRMRYFFLNCSAALVLLGMGVALLGFFNADLGKRLKDIGKMHQWSPSANLRRSPSPETPPQAGAFTVVSTYPTDEAKVLDYRCSQIIVRFNHPVNMTSLKNVKLVGAGVTALRAPEFDDNLSATLKIVGHLQGGQHYKIIVPETVLDSDGKRLARQEVINFSTE